MATIFGSSKRKIDNTDFLWLAYLIFFVIEPVERRSLFYWVECLLIIGVFLAMYVKFLRSDSSKEKVVIALGMSILGATSTPFNGGGIAFLIYACALIPYALTSTAWVFSFTLANVLIIALEGHALHFGIFERFLNIFFAILVASTNMIFAQKERSDCKLRMQQEEIETLAAVAERERIARDLHDVLGHTLSVIVLKSELAHRLLQRELNTPAPELDALRRACTEVADVERTARTALAEVREAIGGYRARGLAAEIDAARHTLATAGVTLRTEGELKPAALTAAEETVLALALREAVTNIVRHAEATACTLRLVTEDARYRLSIEDNGRHPELREGNGLRGMRERIESLGGHLSLTREGGTHLLIDLPLRASLP